MRLKWLLAATFVITCAVPVTSAHAADPTPTWTRTTSQWNRSSSPTIADVNGDGVPEIVIGHEDGYVRVIDRNGSPLPGWPQPAIMSGSSPTSIDSSPAVADLHKDGTPEIIVGVGSKFQPSPHHGGVIVFRNDGRVQCRFFTRDTFNVPTGGGPDGYADGVYSTPAIGDVNGDGFPDIVFGSWDHYVHAIDRNCHEISGFPFNTEDTVWSSPALYDVDHDGRMEIFIGNDYLGTPAFSGGVFHALDWQNGAVRVLWSRRVADVIQSSPAIADINGDGRPDVVVGAGNYFNRSDGHRVFAWDLATGADIAGWPVLTGGVTFSSPALGDLDGNGRPDVVIGSSDGVLQAYRGNGARSWAVHLPFYTGPGHAITASPIIADLNGDGHNDVGVGNDYAFFVVDGRNGSILSRRNTRLAYEAAGAVGNFGSAGWRLIVSGFDTPHHVSTLASYSIPTPGTSPPWPMFRRTPAHIAAPTSGGHPLPPDQCRASSNPVAHESAGSARGYWFIDNKGAVYSFGAAKYYGGLPSLRIPGGAAAITASPGGSGYWILSPAGGVFSFGSAQFHGSMGGHALNAPIIGMSATRTGRGYWLLGRDGGVFSFGDASFYGSMGGRHLNAPIIAMTPTVTGRGYWLLAADGGVFSFGDASFYGSTGGRRLNAPVISMAAGPGGVGYWLLASDGGVFSFRVPFYGSVPGSGLCNVPIGRQIRSSSTGHGYWLLATNGHVFHFGDAKNYGSYTSVTSPAVDIAISR
jgi:hypothetical protein